MAEGVTFRLFGLSEVRQLLSPTKGAQALAAGLDALVAGALQIEGAAKRGAPVRTGRLRASITHEGPLFGGGMATMRVGTNVTYARFIEFGTGQRGAGTLGNLVDSARAAMAAIGYAHGRVAGMAAQPFLFPAYELHRDRIVAAVAAAVRRVMEGRS